MEDTADKGISSTMRAEEEKMRQISEQDEAQRQRKLDGEREKDLKGGPGAVDSKFKALEYLLSQSKVGHSKSQPLGTRLTGAALFDYHAVTNAKARRGRHCKGRAQP